MTGTLEEGKVEYFIIEGKIPEIKNKRYICISKKTNYPRKRKVQKHQQIEKESKVSRQKQLL